MIKCGQLLGNSEVVRALSLRFCIAATRFFELEPRAAPSTTAAMRRLDRESLGCSLEHCVSTVDFRATWQQTVASDKESTKSWPQTQACAFHMNAMIVISPRQGDVTARFLVKDADKKGDVVCFRASLGSFFGVMLTAIEPVGFGAKRIGFGAKRIG